MASWTTVRSKRKTMLLIAILHVVITLVESGCPPPQPPMFGECFCISTDPKELECQDIYGLIFSAMGYHIGPVINTLVILNGSVPILQQDMLQDYGTNLHHLSINNVNITEVDYDAFNQSSQLIDLDLSFNLLQSLPNETFSTNGGPLTMLTTVIITNNQLVQVPDFSQVPLLEHVDLSYNCLVTIDDNAFASNALLATLALNDNLLTVPSSSVVFSLLPSLRSLFLGNNDLMTHGFSSSFLPSPCALESLDMSSNAALGGSTVLPAGMFSLCSSLIDVDLSDNGLTYLEGDLFASCSNLLVARLENNDLPATLNVTWLQGTASLQLLDLSGNSLLSTLEAASPLPSLSNLTTLLLTSAPLLCDCRMGWLQTAAIGATTVSATCAQPPAYAGLSLINGAVDLSCPTTTSALTSTAAPTTTGTPVPTSTTQSSASTQTTGTETIVPTTTTQPSTTVPTTGTGAPVPTTTTQASSTAPTTPASLASTTTSTTTPPPTAPQKAAGRDAAFWGTAVALPVCLVVAGLGGAGAWFFVYRKKKNALVRPSPGENQARTTANDTNEETESISSNP